jgi:Flp pilus assembly protein TadG
MSFRTRLQRLLREERAAVAVTITLLLTGLAGLTGAATDLGMLYTARTELQNAADASALAAADVMLVAEADGSASTDTAGAWATATQYAQANEALGVPLSLLAEDYVIGRWDFDTNSFSSTGDSGNPDDLNAVQVTLRRDDVANTPVSTMFAGIVGQSQVNVQATSLAFLGYAGSAKAGEVDLPIAVDEMALNPNGSPLCGRAIEFHSENDENGSWTTFFDWPTNDPTVKRYVKGQKEIPALEVGDDINIINGNLSNNTFDALKARFDAENAASGGAGWEVLLPVYKAGGNSGAVEVVGFAKMLILDVQPAPDKNILGQLQCGKILPDSATGGTDFGTRATNPKLISLN